MATSKGYVMISEDKVRSEKESSGSIQVLERAATIVGVLEATPTEATLTEVAKLAGLAPSTTHRILNTLADIGIVSRTASGRWALGLKLLELGSIVYDRIIVRERALPLMQLLHEKTQRTVNLCIRDADRIIYVEHVLAHVTGARLVRRIGSSAPLHVTSGGKLFLAATTPEDLSGYISRTHLLPVTDHSITSAEELIVNLGRVRELGWAEDSEEYESGVRCIAAPVKDKAGRVIAALSITFSTRLKFDPLWVKELLATARQISGTMGYRPAQRPKGYLYDARAR